MPFVKRDEQGAIVAVSQDVGPGFEEELPADDMELSSYLAGLGGNGSSLSSTDQDFVRVLEDVVELLIAKGTILFTDLPDSAQDKMLRRQQLRSEIATNLNLIGDD